MTAVLRPVLACTSALLLLCSGVYPAAVTGLARVIFPWQSSGSLLVEGGRVRGSALLGQTFADPAAHPEYFWGRPSAASVDTATGLTVSGGSNLGSSSPSLLEAVESREAALRATGGLAGAVPADLSHASGSGLDPHVSIEGARAQVGRVARVRGVPRAQLEAMVARFTEPPTLAVLGEPGVNVLRLNLALDALRPGAP